MAAIDILEKFQVRASPETVWSFLIDPNAVAACLPGAQLDDVIDERTFNGSMKVKVGPITTTYKGRVTMTNVDEAGRTVEMSAEGREGSGGSVRGGMTSRLEALEGGLTEVTVESKAEITGRIAQFGRGLIQEVSHQLFLQFVDCAKTKLEAMGTATGSPAPASMSAAGGIEETTPATSAATPGGPGVTNVGESPGSEPGEAPPTGITTAAGPGGGPSTAPVPPASEQPPATAPPPPPAAATTTAAPGGGASTASVPPAPEQPTATATAPRGMPAPASKPVSILPIVLKSTWNVIVRTVTSPFRKKGA
jgi:carbon monoxide dehydrogenase subunit G